MRIAYLINSLEGGGAALPVPDLLDVLRADGAEARVFALTRRDGRAIAPIERRGTRVVVRDGGERDHLAAVRWLDRQVALYRPTLLWTSLTRATALGQIVGRRRRLPVVSWQHAAWLRPANRRLLRLTRGLTALWVADSQAVAAFSRAALGIGADRVQVWPIFRADPDAPRSVPWRPGEPLRLGSLGRLHPVKGFDVLLEGLARLPSGLPPVELAIAGDGSAREALAGRIAALGLSGVTLPGFSADPRLWLAGRHLYVQPSRSEGFCVAAHEAMQAGLPVVGSAVGEMARSIQPGVTGWLTPPGDPDTLAAALMAALRDPVRLATLGQTGRARVLDRYGPAAFEQAGRAALDRIKRLVAA